MKKVEVKSVLFLILWYFSPLAYLFFVKKIFLPFSISTFLLFFLGLCTSMLFFGKYKLNSNCKPVSFIFFKYLLFTILLLQIFAFSRLIIGGNLNILNHRQLVFSSPDYLFGSSYVFTLYYSFLLPFVIFTSCFFIAFRGNKKQFNLALLILFFDGIIMLGRFQLIYVVILYLMYRAYNKKNNGNKKLYFLIFLFIILSQLIIFLRQFFYDSSLDSNFSFINFEYFEKSILSYQYYGYLIYETYSSQNTVWGSFFSFNLLNFPIYMFSLIFSKFGILIHNPWELININLSEGVFLSYIGEYSNAFCTNFLPIYLDFGFFGIFLFGLLSGFIIGLNGKSRLLLLTKCLLFFILFFGLYQPIILSFIGFLLFLSFLTLLLKINY